ncbi:MAG: 5'-nucleotidase C-terminal domain-containing protein [Anaerovoracaceae bacterium]|jgi:5'-nucleotidase/UDP-sugar diphosphatase
MKKLISILLSTILVLAAAAPISAAGASNRTISIAFTSDLHSHLEAVNGSGGMARLQTALNGISGRNSSTFRLDAGSFSVGTPFQAIFETDASELRMLGSLDYDAVTLGAPEFAAGADGLARMLQRAALAKRVTKVTTSNYNRQTMQMETKTTFTRTMPELVLGNIDWSASLADHDTGSDTAKLRQAWNRYGASDYTVIRRGGKKIAVFGLMGSASGRQAQNSSGVRWRDRSDRAQEIVDEIKANEKVDMIVCLSDGGLSDPAGKDGEEADLAEDVDGIDLILCSNDGTALRRPVVVGSTTIAAVRGNCTQLGHIVLTGRPGSYKVKTYQLTSLGGSVKQDAATESLVRSYKAQVNGKYMRRYGFYYDQHLTNNPRGVAETADLVSDSYPAMVRRAEGSRYKKVDVAIASESSIASPLARGGISAAEAYDVCGLGFGADGSSGYPLVSAYLSGSELKKLAEAAASFSDDSRDARLHFSGLTYEVNKVRLKHNRAYNIRLKNADGSSERISNHHLYRVVTGLGELNSLDRLNDLYFGLFRVEPKKADGSVVRDRSRLVLHRHGRELKEWQALASYLDHFGGQVPARYSSSDGRAVVRTSLNPLTLFRDFNAIGLIALAIVLIIVVVVIGLLLFLRQRRYARRGFGRRVFTQKKRPRGGKPMFKERRFRMRRR